MNEDVQMMNLFVGFGHAYGTYQIEGEPIPGEKKVGVAKTLRQPVTQRLWQEHLDGYRGLGIIPINEESKVKFGAIDIDIYQLNHEKILDDILKFKMPLVMCRSKSGGAHLYVFLTEFAPAKMVQTKLREMAALLGYGSSEIYPKQTEILTERGDLGQWINMPYFAHKETTRYSFNNERRRRMNLIEFLEYANKAKVFPKDLKDWKSEVPDALHEGPPCLQVLVKQGFPQGTRNNGLFNLGVYAMKSAPDSWEKVTADLNQLYMKPPLTPQEVMGVIKSLKKKEYNYTCTQAPVQPFCNAVKCRMCKFGIGTGSGLPALGTLTKLETKPAIWFFDIEGGKRIELSTEQLQNPRLFQTVCMETLNMVPNVPDKKTWDAMISKMMENVSVIEVSQDMNPDGQLMEAVERYCTGRAQAKLQEEILMGKPWTNGERTYFQVSSLMSYLERIRFKHDGLRYICKVLRSRGGKSDFFIVKNGDGRKGFNVWSVPEFIYRKEGYKPPEQEQQVPFE